MKSVFPKSFFFLCILLIASLLYVDFSTALGVTPSKYTVIYEPNSSHTLTFAGINRKDSNIEVKIFSDGPLNIAFLTDRAVLQANSEKELEATLIINETFDPGTHSSLIYIEEIVDPEKFLIEGTSLTAHEAVAMQVNLKVPYPGKYLELEFDEIKPLKVGEVAYFTVFVHNYGGVELADLKGVIGIYADNGTKVASLDTSEVISLAPLDTKQLRAYWITPEDMIPGPYEASISLDYGGENPAEAKKMFHIGDIFVDILGVSATNVIPGGVAKFSVIIKSEWLQKIYEVYAEALFYDPSDELIGQAKSSSVVLEPLAKDTLVAFWEVPADLADDEYEANIIVHYADKTSERTIKFSPGRETHVEEPVAEVPYLTIIVLLSILIIAVIVLIVVQVARGRKRSRGRKR